MKQKCWFHQINFFSVWGQVAMWQSRCVMGTGPQSLNKEASQIRGFFGKLLPNSNKRVGLDREMAVAVGILQQVPSLCWLCLGTESLVLERGIIK